MALKILSMCRGGEQLLRYAQATVLETKYAKDTIWPLSILLDFRKTPMINKVKLEMHYAGISACMQSVEEIFASGVAICISVLFRVR